MSFTYGGEDTGTLAGVTATLEEWPTLGGLEVESLERPGHHGRFYLGATRDQLRFVFDVLIEGATPEETDQRRDAFVALLDPERGPRPLVLETAPEWEYPDVLVAEEIAWTRLTWDAGLGFVLRADVTLATQGDAAAREVDPQQVQVDGETTFTLDRGTTAARPRMTVDIPAGAAGEDVTVTIGSYSLTVEGGAAAGEQLDLDWQTMEFYRRSSSGSRVGSLVGAMSNYDRPLLQRGEPTTVTCSPAEAAAVLWPNARRT